MDERCHRSVSSWKAYGKVSRLERIKTLNCGFSQTRVDGQQEPSEIYRTRRKSNHSIWNLHL